MPITLEEYERFLDAPALCEQLRIRDLLDNVAIQVDGSFVAAYELAYHQANPADFDRLDNTLSFSFAYYPIPEISIGPYVRPSARIYFTDTSYQRDRDDFNLSEGIDITWQPCKYAALSADLSHTDDYSNNAGQSYSDTVPGLSVTGTPKF